MNLAEHRHLGITATCSTQERVEEGLGSQRGCTREAQAGNGSHRGFLQA